MIRVAINSPNAPKPRAVNGQALYNQAIVANGFVFCSGQLPKGPNGKFVAGTVQDRTVKLCALTWHERVSLTLSV
jgi:enamine deaminase RidA (YjgF/YER057c/UK114 family)